MNYLEIQRMQNIALRKLKHAIILSGPRVEDAYEWCHEYFGTKWRQNCQHGIWACFGVERSTEQYRFCFAESKDAVFFALKWS